MNDDGAITAKLEEVRFLRFPSVARRLNDKGQLVVWRSPIVRENYHYPDQYGASSVSDISDYEDPNHPLTPDLSKLHRDRLLISSSSIDKLVTVNRSLTGRVGPAQTITPITCRIWKPSSRSPLNTILKNSIRIRFSVILSKNSRSTPRVL